MLRDASCTVGVHLGPKLAALRSGERIVVGDGPKQAGDDFLEAHADRIDVSFVMGSALFIKLSEG
ncbi:MAG: hypothetical protein WAO78_06760 [Roseovarius sp.]